MTTLHTPESLALHLLGRNLEELAPEEQHVLRSLAAGNLAKIDDDERSALNATFADRLADRVAAVGGSWSFIITCGVALSAWMLFNSALLAHLIKSPFDPYPYIFLNLILSMLAALQAPVIMMSQNRQSVKDRIAARHDYEVNLRTQLELLRLHRKLDKVVEKLGHAPNAS